MKSTGHRVAVNLGVALGYALSGYVTLRLGHTSGIELRRVLWVPSGIALAVSVLVPHRVWPGTAVGAFGATLLDGSGALFALATAGTNSFEVGFGTWLLRRVGFVADLARPRVIVYLVTLAAGLAAALSALGSASALIATGGAPPELFGRLWIMWWLTHAMGIMIVVPTAIAFAVNRPADWAGTRRIGLILIAVLASTWIPFTAAPGGMTEELFFLPVFVLLFAAIHVEMMGSALGTFILTAAAVSGAVFESGPLIGATPNETLFLTWSFTSVTIVSVLVAGAIETERARASENVIVGVRRLGAVLDATGDGILVVDEGGRITDVNPTLLAIVGETAEKTYLERPGQELLARLAPPGGCSGPAGDVLKVSPDSSASLEGEWALDDGRWVHMKTAPLVGPAGLSGRTWSVRDVTERITSERERERLQEQILHAQKLEGLGVLAGGVAHDFNNLLMGITGYADLLRDETQLDEQARADVDRIIETAAHASQLCGQMLTYAGKTTPALAPVDLGTCIRDISTLLSVSITKSVDMVLDLPKEPLFAMADEGQIRQVLLNLATNASESVLARGQGGAVAISARRQVCDRGWLDRALLQEDIEPGEYALLVVSDDGLGLDQSQIAKIFDPFFSSKGAGRGLGLSSTLGVIRAHGGTILVESEPDQGARFTVALPIAPHGPVEEAAVIKPHVHPELHTVLIVDDEEHVRDVVRRMVERGGYRTEEAGDGEEALERLAAGPPVDLVLLDLTMPRRDGLSTLHEMRERGHDIPVLVASGYSRHSLPEEISIAGFVHKPFRKQQLLDAIYGVLEEPPVG